MKKNLKFCEENRRTNLKSPRNRQLGLINNLKYYGNKYGVQISKYIEMGQIIWSKSLEINANNYREQWCMLKDKALKREST